MNRGSVLIVDDEKNIRLTLAMALETLNLQVEMAAHGEEALQKLAEKSYDLILLDMRLPGLDGMEVLSRVVKTWSQSKVIVITAYGSSEMAVEAMTLGAVDFLPKPFDPEDVRKTVTHILDQVAIEKRRAQEEDF
jgi:DNA-binding NtrC family response regulator